MSLEDEFFLTNGYETARPFITHMARVFQEELERRDQVRPLSQPLSNLYKSHHSKDALLLCLILDQMADLEELRKVNATLLDQILDRSPQNMAQITSQWKSFTEEFFTSRGRPVPDWPQYVNIQEELGMMGKTVFHRYGRRVKRLAQGSLKNIFEAVCRRFPQWEWAKRRNCYFAAALVPEYFLQRENSIITCLT